MKTTNTARLETLNAMIDADPFLEFEAEGTERDAIMRDMGIDRHVELGTWDYFLAPDPF